MAQTAQGQHYLDPAHATVHISSDGPFPFRILYLHTSKSESPGVTLRWSRPRAPVATGAPADTAIGTPPPVDTSAADEGEAASVVYAYETIPAGRIFTDAKMEKEQLLTGSVPGFFFFFFFFNFVFVFLKRGGGGLRQSSYGALQASLLTIDTTRGGGGGGWGGYGNRVMVHCKQVC